jgi:YXWGXW repeat-containing protein
MEIAKKRSRKGLRKTIMDIKRSGILRWLLLAVVVMSFSAASFGQIGVGISVRIGPPALPVYAQPIAPGPGYMWTPGYWGWNDGGGYYWVPGTWVVAPIGLLWTPGYWGWGGGLYAWHAGYWGPHIGFYGGINYGFGYGGVGFVGGEWRGGAFFYNRSVSNVSVTNVTNVYNRTVVVNNTSTTSFNGGTGGVQARPTAAEQAAASEPHTAPLAAQTQHEQMASQNKGNFASENGGKPAIAATSKAGDFSSKSAVPARAAGGEYHAPAMSPKEARVSTPASASSGSKSNEGFKSFNSPSNNAANKSETSNSTPKSNTSSNNSYKPAPKQKSSPPPSHKSSPPPKNHGKGR